MSCVGDLDPQNGAEITDVRGWTEPARQTRCMSRDRWVCLDVGETLIDETRIFGCWAQVLGVPSFTLAGLLGGMVACGRPFTDALAALDPGWEALDAVKEQLFGGFQAGDVYPDVLPALWMLGERGYRVAIIANQPARRHAELQALGIDPEVMAMSDAIGVAKPDPAFFVRVLDLLHAEAQDVVYVGDRVDNDVVPAAAAGLRAVWIRRGPWSLVQTDDTGAAALEVRSLTELVERIHEAFPEPTH